jgi:hypothetical protein
VEGADLKETTLVDGSSGSRHHAHPPAEVLRVAKVVNRAEGGAEGKEGEW